MNFKTWSKTEISDKVIKRVLIDNDHKYDWTIYWTTLSLYHENDKCIEI